MSRNFDGTNDSIQAAVNYSGFSTLTVCFWLNWDSFGTDDDLAFELTANFNSVNTGFLIDPNSSSPDAFLFAMRDNSQYQIETLTRPSALVWHHYAIVFVKNGPAPGTYIKVYLNGVLQSTTNGGSITGGTGNFANSNLNFMCRNNTSLFGDGKMAYVQIYSRELTLNEIKMLMVAPGLTQRGILNFWFLQGGSPEPDYGPQKIGGTVSGATVSLTNPPINSIFTIPSPDLMAVF